MEGLMKQFQEHQCGKSHIKKTSKNDDNHENKVLQNMSNVTLCNKVL